MALADLFYPSNVTYKDLNPHHAEFSFEPLESGYGYTLGFALQQSALRTLSGFAITKMKINGGNIAWLHCAFYQPH